jgi:hypothetical protein
VRLVASVRRARRRAGGGAARSQGWRGGEDDPGSLDRDPAPGIRPRVFCIRDR